jgi:hypothetical protein
MNSKGASGRKASGLSVLADLFSELKIRMIMSNNRDLQ